MLDQFARLFNIRRDELRRLTIISIMMVFFIIGYVWANITIISNFVSNLGTDKIPLLLIGDAVIIIVTFAGYSAVADRWANHHIMAGLAAIGIVGIVIGVVLLRSESTLFGVADAVGWTSFFLYLVFRSVGEAISTHWGPLVNDYFDTRAAKRIFTLLGGVVRLSYIVGALSLAVFNDSAPELILLGLSVWIVTLLGIFIMSVFMPRLMRVEVVQPISQNTDNTKGYWQNLYEGYQFAFKSYYLRAFVVASILMMILLALMQFEVLAILDETYAGADAERQIADFLSQITFWGSVALLPFQLFVFNRLVSWAGVETVNLVFPTTSLLAALALAAIPFLNPEIATFAIPLLGITIVIGIAMFAEFNRTILNIGIRAINDEFLYNAVPVRVKGRTRGFISGIVEPFGTLLAGLIVSLPLIGTSDLFVPILLVGFAIAYLLSSLWVSRQYGRALISMIEEENYSFLLEANNRIAIDSETVQSLERRFKQAEDDDTRLLMARLLIEARGDYYLDLLLSYAENGSKYLRAGMIDSFVSADLRSPKVIDMCVKYILDSDPIVRKSAITGLKQLVGVESERYLLAALELLNDNDISLVSEVLPDLINTRDFYFLQHATQTLNELLEHEEAQQRAIGVRILGNTDSSRVLLLLLRYILDRSQVVRLQAVLAIETLSSQVSISDELVNALSMTISSLLRDPLDRIRVSAVNILASIHPTDFAERIMPALLDDNLEVREIAVQLLMRDPNATRATFEPLLESSHSLMSRMTSVVLVRLNKKYEAQIYDHIDIILANIYLSINRILALQSLTDYPIIEVVQNILSEENDQSLKEIFYLLGSIHGIDDVNIAVDAINSTIPRTRANGIEALDVMLPLRPLTAIENVTNPEMSLEELSVYGSLTYETGSFTPAQVLRELLDQHNEDWKVYIGIEALGELGHSLTKSQSIPDASPLDLLMPAPQVPHNNQATIPFTIQEIERLLDSLKGDLPLALRTALRKAQNAINGIQFERSNTSYGTVISDVERIIFLKHVDFFHSVTINQLRKVANICQEVWFDAEQVIFNQGDIGGQLYIIIEGRVGIEQTQSDGKSARLNTLNSEESFGEDTLFDESRHSTSAIALSQTLTLRLDNDDFTSLVQSYPEMTMDIIRVLSSQVRQIDQRITSMTRQESQAENLFDKLGL
ncbi:MAG: hypothetical protein Phog2KO_23540 [Phototrophicaceae bacterium]